MEIVRPEPPLAASEKEMLMAWLDYERATLMIKINGVSDEDLRRRVIPSTTMTLLGIVKHLGYAERGWFQVIFGGQDAYVAWIGKEGLDADWQIEPNETTADVLAFYQTEMEKSRAIVAAHDLDQVAQKTDRNFTNLTLRWIMLHMIEETARHNGHADLIREAIDGVVGE